LFHFIFGGPQEGVIGEAFSRRLRPGSALTPAERKAPALAAVDLGFLIRFDFDAPQGGRLVSVELFDEASDAVVELPG